VVTLLQTGLSNAALATLLALVALLVARRCTRPAVVHSLWLLALLKLITPPLVPLPIPWPAALEPTPSVIHSEPAADATGPGSAVLVATTPPARVQDAATGPLPVEVVERGLGPSAAADTPTAAAGLLATVRAQLSSARAALAVCLSVWLAGAMGWFLLAAGRVWRFHLLLRHAQRAPEDLEARVRRLANRLELPRCPDVWLLPGALAPMIWAVGRARLLLPAGLLPRLDDEAQITLLLHEMAHLRRRDHWVRWLEVVVLGLYWWYPPVWWMRRQLQAAEEECCDAWVVGELPYSSRAYASALLDAVDFVAEARPRPLLASRLGEAHNLERRLRRILRGRTPRALSGPGRLVWLALAALLLPLVPTRVSLTAQAMPAPAAEPGQTFATPPALPEVLPLPDQPAAPALPAPQPAVAAAPRAAGNRSPAPGPWLQFLQGRRAGVTAVAFAPDGRTVAVAHQDRSVQLWDVQTRTLRLTLTGHHLPVTSVAFAPDGTTLATAGGDPAAARGEVLFWDMAAGQERNRVTGLRATVHQVAFAPDGRSLVTAGGDGRVLIWDAAEGTVRTQLSGHRQAVRSIAFSPSGDLLATAGQDGVLRLWETATWREQRSFPLAGRTFAWVAFAPDGSLLATADNPGEGPPAVAIAADADGAPDPGEPGVIRLWDLASGEVQAELRGHAGKIIALAFAPDGQALASVGTSAEALDEFKVWNLAAEEEQASIYAPQGRLGGVAFSPDGSTVATGTAVVSAAHQ
jgi:bla regulator protein blaR1